MTRLIAAVALLVVVATAQAIGQAQWEEVKLDGSGYELWLRNDDGAAIVLRCVLRGVSVGFEMPWPFEDSERARIRAIPGERQNAPLARAGENLARVESNTATRWLFEVRQESARLNVRVAGEDTTFQIFGSQQAVRLCQQKQEGGFGTGAAVSRRPEE